MKTFLKFAGLSLAAIGLFISAAEAFEWIPNSRADLAHRIMALGDDVLPLDEEDIDDLLHHFLGEAKYSTYRQHQEDMTGIAIEEIKMNAYVMGTVYLQHKTGKRHQLCSYEQLHEWANSNKTPFWLGWWVALIGVIIALAVEILDLRSSTKS